MGKADTRSDPLIAFPLCQSAKIILEGNLTSVLRLDGT